MTDSTYKGGPYRSGISRGGIDVEAICDAVAAEGRQKADELAISGEGFFATRCAGAALNLIKDLEERLAALETWGSK